MYVYAKYNIFLKYIFFYKSKKKKRIISYIIISLLLYNLLSNPKFKHLHQNFLQI